MSWDEGKPMPATEAGKKKLAKQMLGGKVDDHDGDEDQPSTGVPIKGKLVDVRIDPASNGHSLRITRKTGDENVAAGDEPQSYDQRHQDYNTVHTNSDDLLAELKRHLDSSGTD